MIIPMDKFFNFFENRKEGINKFLIFFLTSYFILITAPYIFARVPALDSFFTTSPTNIVYRSLTTIYFVIYLLFVAFANKIKINWPITIVGITLLLLYIVSSAASPKFYDINGTIYNISATSYAVSYFRFAADVICFAMLIMFIPPILKDVKHIYPIVYILVAILVIACIYSFITEWDNIKALMDGKDEYAYPVKSLFHSKNAFGLFLFVASLGATFVIYTSKEIKYILILFLPLLLFVIMTALIGCKTALISNLILLLSMFAYAIYLVFKEDKKIGIVFISIFSALLLLFILYMAIPSFHSGSLSWLYDVVCRFFNRMSYYFDIRVNIWSNVNNVVYDGYMVCGVSDANMAAYLGATQGLADFHSAYVSFYVSHGILGTAIYAGIFGWIIYLIVKLFKKDKVNAILIAIFLICSAFMAVPETYTLFLGISSYAFVINLIIVVYLLYSLKSKQDIVEQQ